jgi:hypothetical protein
MFGAFPELTKRMLLVGSLRKDGVTISQFSNLPGDFYSLFVYAPGENVTSMGAHEGLTELSGTSMATPHVSGILTLMSKYFPRLSAAELKECLIESCDPFWAEANNKFSHEYDMHIHGKGRVNAEGAMAAAQRRSFIKERFRPAPSKRFYAHRSRAA